MVLPTKYVAAKRKSPQKPSHLVVGGTTSMYTHLVTCSVWALWYISSLSPGNPDLVQDKTVSS